MNQKLLVMIAGVLLLVIIFVVFGGKREDAALMPEVAKESGKMEQSSESANERKVEIKYEQSAKNDGSSVSTITKTEEAVKHSSSSAALPTIIAGAMARTSKYEIMLTTDSKVVSKASNLPLLPPMISGTIDGEQFSIVLPSAIENEDLRFVIKNMESGEIKVSSIKLGKLESGARYNAQILYHAIDSTTILKDTGTTSNDFPPMPPAFN